MVDRRVKLQASRFTLHPRRLVVERKVCVVIIEPAFMLALPNPTLGLVGPP